MDVKFAINTLKTKKSVGYFSAAMDCGIGWPTKERTLTFEGKSFLLIPPTQDTSPTIHMKLEGDMTDEESYSQFNRFLSSLAWAQNGKLIEIFHVQSSAPMGVGGHGTRGMISDAPIEYLPNPTDPKARFALALYREAISLDSNVIPYKFLGYFKILNIFCIDGKTQKAWIGKALPNIKEWQAVKRLKELPGSHAEIAAYLYREGRCAVAHAYEADAVNPDNPIDQLRMHADLPLVKALAEYAIEVEFGVKSLSTIETEHLYELEGFKEIIGKDVVAKLVAKEKLQQAEVILPPKISIGIRGETLLGSFQDMDCCVAQIDGAVVWVKAWKPYFDCLFALCFDEESLIFNAAAHVSGHDDGTKHGAQILLDYETFFHGWVHNGVVEIWSSGKRIGRSQPTMIVNGRPPDSAAMEKRIAVLEARLKA